MNEDMSIGNLIADQLARLFNAQLERPLRKAVETDASMPLALWDDVELLGVTLAMVGEGAGGASLSWGQVEPIFRQLGQYAAPLPLGETMVGAWALYAAGLEIPAGPIAVVTAVCKLALDGTVSGQDSLVSWPNAGRSVLVAARGADGMNLCLIDPIQALWRPLSTYGRIPSASMHLRAVMPLSTVALPPGMLPHGLLPLMAILRSVQIAGALDHVLSLCTEYANNRVQFGKPIGKFQAVQQLLADLAGQVAAAGVAGMYGCRKMDVGQGTRGAGIAKIRTALSATRGAAIAHQVFGAIGITDEHELHYYTRRLWQWRAEGGSDHSWSEFIGRKVLEEGGAALWPALCAG